MGQPTCHNAVLEHRLDYPEAEVRVARMDEEPDDVPDAARPRQLRDSVRELLCGNHGREASQVEGVGFPRLTDTDSLPSSEGVEDTGDRERIEYGTRRGPSP